MITAVLLYIRTRTLKAVLKREVNMVKKFKKIIIAAMLVLSLGTVTACGGTGSDVSGENNDVLEREVELGNRLKEKAKDNVEQQGEHSEQTDDMLDNIPTE